MTSFGSADAGSSMRRRACWRLCNHGLLRPASLAESKVRAAAASGVSP